MIIIAQSIAALGLLIAGTIYIVGRWKISKTRSEMIAERIHYLKQDLLYGLKQLEAALKREKT